MRGVLLLMTVLTLAAAMPADEVERLLRAGRQAYDRGDYRRALDLLTRAEPHSADPAPVTFALAGTHYRLALANGDDATNHLAQATALFRCLMTPEQPYAVRAQLGLAGCLLLRAGRSRDYPSCEEALRVLDALVATPLDEPLDREARRLFHRARLMEWQLLPTPPETSPTEPPPPDPDKMPPMMPMPPMPPEKAPNEKDMPAPKDKTGTRPTPVEGPNGPVQEKKDGPQGTRAAEGNSTSVKDREPLPPPLEADVALQRLREATRRIQAEQKAFRRSLSRPPAEGVPDW